MPQKHLNREGLENAIEEAWRAMHHNASYSHHFPDIDSEAEWDMFYSVLGDETGMWRDDLESQIKERFSWTVHIYSYGRQGATYAPSEFMQAVGGSGFGPLKIEWYEYSGLEGYNQLFEILRMFEYINEFCKANAAYIPEWWAETKKANEWIFEKCEACQKVKLIEKIDGHILCRHCASVHGKVESVLHPIAQPAGGN